MSVPFRSVDDLLANSNSKGSFTRFFYSNETANVTAGTTTAGYVTARRFSNAITLPAFTGNAYLTYGRVFSSGTLVNAFMALEVTLGTLTISGNSFADGSVMPTRRLFGGSSVQTASMLPMLWVSTTTVATTPTLTVTYTNQAGATSHTAAPVLTTGTAANTAINLLPHLQSGDTGIQDVTGMSISAGTGGVVKAVGLIPLVIANQQTSSTSVAVDPLGYPYEMFPLQGSDVLSFWVMGNSISTMSMTAALQINAET